METHQSLLSAMKAIRKGSWSTMNSSFLDDFYNKPCIYFLISEYTDESPDIVYIGKTTSLGKRIGAHYSDKGKEFDCFSYFFVANDLLDELEEILISIFHPKYNDKGYNWYTKKIAKYMRIKSVSHLKKSYGISSDPLNFDMVIKILEYDGDMGRWMAKKLEMKLSGLDVET